jgi:hypothetical protein
VTCKLCSSNNLIPVSGKDDREYLLCNSCNLISVKEKYFLTEYEEKKRYLEHENGIYHTGYVNFLNRAIQPLLQYLTPDMIGLDYGCGYAPTISELLRKDGFICHNYDPIFFPDTPLLQYNFIFSTEVFEHFFYPSTEMKKLADLLMIKGFLVIMSERWNSIEQFSNWYYTTDPTHVAFYNNTTFDYICIKYKFEKLYDDGSRVLILKKI